MDARASSIPTLRRGWGGKRVASLLLHGPPDACVLLGSAVLNIADLLPQRLPVLDLSLLPVVNLAELVIHAAEPIGLSRVHRGELLRDLRLLV